MSSLVPAPERIAVDNLWELAADPPQIGLAAQAWRSIADAARTARTTVDSGVAGVSGWRGAAGHGYLTHARQLSQDVAMAAAAADDIGGALDRAYGYVCTARRHLRESLRRAGGRVSYALAPDRVEFYPRNHAEVAAIETAVGEANRIRRDLDEALFAELHVVDRQWSVLRDVSGRWYAAASGSAGGWSAPPDSSRTQVILTAHGTIVSTGPGDDVISVQADPATGEPVVMVNGQPYRVPSNLPLTIRAGAGNDVIEVSSDVYLALRLIGGEGHDTIVGGWGDDVILGLGGHDVIASRAGQDRVSGGAGHDFIDGGAGRDILTGGMGYDVIYGMDGDDQISGGEGQDYLAGASGADAIYGDAGFDVLAGGDGDDQLDGGDGADQLHAGKGRDRVDGGAGADIAYYQHGDIAQAERLVTVDLPDLDRYFVIEGSPEFIARVRADLEMLASSPRGQLILSTLDAVRTSNVAPEAVWVEPHGHGASTVQDIWPNDTGLPNYWPNSGLTLTIRQGTGEVRLR